jgi:hypothetical protein
MSREGWEDFIIVKERAMNKQLVSLLLILSAPLAHAGIVCYGYKYAPNLVVAVQQTLKVKGIYTGEVDGKWGPKTREAVRIFQLRKHVEVTPSSHRYSSNEGELETATLKALFGDKATTEGIEDLPNPYHVSEAFWEESCL